MSKIMEDVNSVKSLLTRVHHGEAIDSIKSDYSEQVEKLDLIDVFKMILQVNHTSKEITIYDIKEFFEIHHHLYGHDVNEIHISDDVNHPLHVLRKENHLLSDSLNIIQYLVDDVENGEKNLIDTLIAEAKRLGEINCHFNRKEKLYFPILERYGIYPLPRTIWKLHDQIRLLIKGLVNRLHKIDSIEFRNIRRTFDDLKAKCEEMILEEDLLIIPITQILFKEKDWLAIAEESSAFGYAVELNGKYRNYVGNQRVKPLNHTEQLQFGGGYLTTREANIILNNLPLEITFVDKNGLFKYFNNIVESSEMMFIRTPLSIGRNVSNCHPPKSLKKVMYVIRDLKNKVKESETMWFKTKDKYIHITYKAVFDEEDEFMGILEYVQDIQPFFELPSAVKRNVSK
ncbi:PAS domain-containing protein [Salinicoccus sp. YB14-2]|uniref:PAS domain-containing protein n=1 Tax=Salinicoccus sp. YB14-2 TaxID=1572701 RepID=UPI000AFE5732|nr:PAS domain-containing protein [Salinicoccus sp. YB14-2]